MAINTLPNIVSNGGPHRCSATLRDDYGEAVEMRSQEITFNIITFQDKQEFIEWHKNTFKESILVDEYSPVKWVVGFTIHSKNRQFQGPPLLEFTKIQGKNPLAHLKNSILLTEIKYQVWLPNKL